MAARRWDRGSEGAVVIWFHTSSETLSSVKFVIQPDHVRHQKQG